MVNFSDSPYNKIVMKFNFLIYIIIGLAVIFRLVCLLNYGNDLSLYSDDKNYIVGAINFLRNGGHIVYGPWTTEPVMIIMPGYILILGFLFSIFGYTEKALIICRIFFICLSALSMWGLYKICLMIFNRWIGLIALIIIAFWPPLILLDNLFLTETVAFTPLVWFIYFTLKYCESKSDKDFLLLLFFYILSLYIRNGIALLPLVFVFYYITKKFPLKLLLTRGVYAIIIISIALFPWWVRNYQVVNKFVLTTAGDGDALLMGTRLGNYPVLDENIKDFRYDFVKDVDRNSLYIRMLGQKTYAKQILSYWWENDKSSFLYTYLIIKPKFMWERTLYYGEVFDIRYSLIQKIYRIILSICFIGCLIGLARKSFRQGTILCLLMFLYSTIFGIIYLPYARYNYNSLPFVFIMVAVVIYTLFNMAYTSYIHIKKNTGEAY